MKRIKVLVPGQFNVQAPVSHPADIAVLYQAGAREFYGSYITPELAERWPAAFNILSQCGQGKSIENKSIFEEVVAETRLRSLPLYVTISGQYTPEQYPFLQTLTDYIETLDGVNGVVIADVGLLLVLRSRGFKKEIQMSAGGASSNARGVDFFYTLGANRVVLDRQMTGAEISKLLDRQRTTVEVDLPVIGEICEGFIGGLCAMYHCIEKKPIAGAAGRSMFCSVYNTTLPERGCDFYHMQGPVQRFSAVDGSATGALTTDRTKAVAFGCGICDLYRLKKYPIRSLKVLDRGKGLDDIRRCVAVASGAAELMRMSHLSESAYRVRCRRLLGSVMFEGKYACAEQDCYFSPYWKRHGKTVRKSIFHQQDR